MRCWRLDAGEQTLVLASRGGALPEVVYWAARLPAGEDLEALAHAARPDIAGGTLDSVIPVSLCPEAGRAFPGHPGLLARHGDGRPLAPILRLVEVTTAPDRLHVRAEDPDEGLQYHARIAADAESGVMTLEAEIGTDAPILLEWLAAPVLPAPAASAGLIDFAGRWCGEFRPVRSPWRPGIRARLNRTGRTGHEHFPGLVVLGPEGENGPVWQFHHAWSGGHQMLAEELPDGRRQLQFGHAPGSHHRPARHFRTAPLIVGAFPAGRPAAARAFQRHLRRRILPRPASASPRPVHYNCWEAIYFDHDEPRLRRIAERAASLGAERFVLDDGWFGRRDHDRAALGDWVVDRRKWPHGLRPFADFVRSLGMQFGIWFEPEMVSPDSDLARAHGDWILGRAEQPLGRHQLVLDVARSDVRDHLFAAIAAVLEETGAQYVKWDHNRVLPGPDAAQTEGFFALLDRLRERFPDAEWESCASGGGRIDYAVLSRASRVWLSDSNDALERQRIQHWAAQFLPATVTGSHVGPRQCHTSGRVLPMAFRAWTAAARHMGFEMDPDELTAEEETVLRRVIAWWKGARDWLMEADILPLPAPDRSICAEMHLAADGSRFVVFAARLDSPAATDPGPLRLPGLPRGSRWRITRTAPEGRPAPSRGDPALAAGPLTLSAEALEHAGLRLPQDHPHVVDVLEGVRT